MAFLGGSGSVGQTLADVQPHLAAIDMAALPIAALEAASIADAVDLVFSALPNGSSAGLLPAVLEAGVRAIDLAGDFRLAPTDYPTWYGFDHPAPAWLDAAVYGLPELFAAELPGATLVANPGCFATAAILACAPLLGAGLVEPGTIRVDGKTGVSGAGRAGGETTSFAATEDSIRPYRVPGHQHIPEMELALARSSGVEVVIVFVPHLVPAVRGVVTTCYLTLAPGATTESLTECLAEAYRERPFVRVLPPGAMVDAKRTRGSNVLELQAVADGRSGTAVVAGALDNLVKGAAGQADSERQPPVRPARETTGLPGVAVYP